MCRVPWLRLANSKLSGSYRLCDWQLRQRKLQHMGNGLSLCHAIALMILILAKNCSSVCKQVQCIIYILTTVILWIMQLLIIKRKYQRHLVLQQLDSVLYLEPSLMGQHQVNLIVTKANNTRSWFTESFLRNLACCPSGSSHLTFSSCSIGVFSVARCCWVFTAVVLLLTAAGIRWARGGRWLKISA